MKVNMPVTDQEVHMRKGTILVTKTDPKGRITYANDEFIKISGFSKDELIGKNHNLVRHPDMPPAAFEDLWDTIKNGFPWKQLVKNRCKNGDYYWVEANVTAIYENMRLKEFMSVRYAPSIEQVANAEAVYAKINAGKATLRPTGLLSRLNFFAKFKLWKKLATVGLLFSIPGFWLLTQAILQNDLITTTVVSIIMLTAITTGFLVLRYMQNALGQITNVLYRLTDGGFRNNIDLDLEDDIGDLLRAMQGMQVKLNFDLNEANSSATESQRIKQALDTVNSGVMVADNNYNIIYLNQTVQELFENAQNDIRTDLPDFDASTLLGTNIDVFHKNPEYQRKMLDQLQNTFKSKLVIGGRHLDFIANPVLDNTGERIGIVVEWLDRTEEVAVENEIAGIVSAAKSGDLSQRLNIEGKEGFLLTLSRGINDLTDNMDRVSKDINHVVANMSSGNLTDKITGDYEGVYANLKNDINSTQDKLAEVFGQIGEAADFISQSSQEIASGNNNLSQRAEEQASSLEETAASMEQLTSTVKNNADNSQQANLMATTAGQLAGKGGEVVKQAMTAMEEINTSSNKIANIISVIDEIAFQTNLLALNASVEAARAGEQGRGFSVVATEVRNLAQRCANAAKESKDLIQSSMDKVRIGSDLVSQSGQTLDDIVTSVKKVGDIIAEIAAASQEQSAGIEQVNQAVTQMDEITQQNAALAEQASAASVSMTEQSQSMVQLLNFFKNKENAVGSAGGPASQGGGANTLDFTLARSKHLAWKTRLRGFLDGSESLSMSEAVSHRDCALGKWLYPTGISSFGHLPEMQTMEKQHETMHSLIRDILTKKESGDIAGAEADFNRVAAFSDNIVEALHKLEAIVNGGVAETKTTTPVTPAPTQQPAVTPPSSGDEWADF